MLKFLKILSSPSSPPFRSFTRWYEIHKHGTWPSQMGLILTRIGVFMFEQRIPMMQFMFSASASSIFFLVLGASACLKRLKRVFIPPRVASEFTPLALIIAIIARQPRGFRPTCWRSQCADLAPARLTHRKETKDLALKRWHPTFKRLRKASCWSLHLTNHATLPTDEHLPSVSYRKRQTKRQTAIDHQAWWQTVKERSMQSVASG